MSDNSTLPAATDQKKKLRNYIGQLNFLELDRLKLKNLNKELEQEKIDIVEQAKAERDYAKERVKQAQAYYEETKKMKHKLPSYKLFPLITFIKYLLIGCGLGVLLVAILAKPIDSLWKLIFGQYQTLVSAAITIILFALAGGALFTVPTIVSWASENKEIKRRHDERVANLEGDKADIHHAEEEVENCEKNIIVAKAQAQTIDMQIKINEKNISKMGLIIQKMHELDIIPPDYRTTDCIITLEHIFKNDLADTVRDAVLLYKDWVYHELIITGLDNIYKMLGNLSESMQYMQRTLESIDQSVSAMSDDMTRLIGLQKESNRTQEQILQESQATRSATESIRQSNEKYEWYVEQHRQGLL